MPPFTSFFFLLATIIFLQTEIIVKPDSVKFDVAKEACKSLQNGRLISIHDVPTQWRVEDAITKSKNKKWMWIGLSGTVMLGKYNLKWVDGTDFKLGKSFENFDNSFQKTDSVACAAAGGLWTKLGKWVHLNSSEARPSICEYSPEPTSGNAVNGGWSPWSKYGSDCSKSCEGGTKEMVRTCNNPVPQNGGKNCDGDDKSTEVCNKQACPTGEDWTDWTDCDQKCGKGYRYSHLKCGNETCTGELEKANKTECNTYDQKRCGNLCERTENQKVCPQYAKCKDESANGEPKIRCVCVMGYEMQDDDKCRRPKPSTPTPRPIPTLSAEQKTIVVIVTSTASTVLLIMVGLTLAIFMIFRIYTPDRVIQMNMEIAIEIAHLLLLIPYDSLASEPVICHLVSIGLHFFFTACFCFMMMEALHMYSLVAFVVQRNGLFTRMQNTLIGWGLATFFMVFGLCFHYQDYGGKYHCWLQMDTRLLYAQLVPIICVAIMTLILIEAAGADDYKPLEAADEKQRFSAKLSQRSNLIIMPLVFASWILGILSTYEQNLPLFSSFSALNTALGIIIFAFHTLGNHEVRKRLKNVFCGSKSKPKRK